MLTFRYIVLFLAIFSTILAIQFKPNPKVVLLHSNVTFSTKHKITNNSETKYNLPKSFTKIAFSCTSTYPTEWIFDCPKNSVNDVIITKDRRETNGVFDFTSTVVIIFTESINYEDSRDWANLTCKNSDPNYHTQKTSVIATKCDPNPILNSTDLCIEIRSDVPVSESCISDISDTRIQNQPNSKCLLNVTLAIDLVDASFQCIYKDKSTSNQSRFDLNPFYCDTLDYCTSISKRTKDIDHCVEFTNLTSSPKKRDLFRSKPILVRCTVGSSEISKLLYVAPNKNGTGNFYSNFTKALEANTIIKIHPTLSFEVDTQWEGQEIEYECIATLSLFSKGFSWAFKNKSSNKQIPIFPKNTRGMDLLTQTDLENHVYRTRMRIKLTTEMSQVICKGPVINSRVWKTASLNIIVQPSISPSILYSNKKNETDFIILNCKASSGPPPIITWHLNNNTIVNNTIWVIRTNSIGNNETDSSLTFSKEELQKLKIANIVCNATNNKGSVVAIFKLDLDDGSFYKTTTMVLGIGSVVLLCGLGIMSFFLYKWIKKRRNTRKLTEQEINAFRQGAKTADQFCGAMIMPYDTNYEIPRENIIMDGAVLGAGQFGVVVKGNLLDSNRTPIAIKTIRETTDISFFKSLLSELKILQYVGNHPNIVNLIGACTGNIRKMEVLLILDYCSNGSMVKFLRSCRPTFIDYLHTNDGSTDATVVLYQNNCMRMLTTRDLIRMAFEIAKAMEFIAQKQILHGDLSARNVLITDNKTAKVCDFGLAKQLFEYSVYIQRVECPLPLRWMAIESLQDMEFSIQSDVWSFGVCLWEIFTLAELPYPGVNWSFESWKLLRDGYRLEQPQYSNTSLYGIMMRCWNCDPKQRPTFSQLASSLEDELHALR